MNNLAQYDNLPDADDDTVSTDQAESGPVSAEIFELWATILIALAAIATAWAGFESAKWGGVQATNFSQAGAARTESVRYSTQAGQEQNIDINTFANWLNVTYQEISTGVLELPTSGAEYQPVEGTLSAFYFNRFREEFSPAVRAWLDTNPFGSNPDAPPTPFVMDEYQLASAQRSAELQNDADQRARDAATANQNSDNYVMTAVLFASALFFASLASRLGSIQYRYASLIVATLMFSGTLIYILTLPIEF